ncbi:MAG: ATP-binding cassette domain-containing protein [Oscillospiraceae bacterium]|nr:ATP-binding cassette domain-containing protein [Oscillospiraceae bacterium]
MFDEAFRNLADVVVGESAAGAPGNEHVRAAVVMEELGRCLNVAVPYASNPERGQEWVQENLFRPRGIMWRKVQLKDGWYEDAIGVMLGSFTDGRPVVLVPARTRGYLFQDPDTGKRVRITKSLAGRFRSEATLYYRPLPARKIDTKDLRQFIRDSVSFSEILLLLAATVAALLLSMVTPMMTKLLVTDVIAFADLRLLNVVLSVLILAAAAAFFVTSMKQMILVRISTKVAIPLQAAFMMRVLTAPAGRLKEFSAGDLGTRIGSLYVNLKLLLNMFLSAILTAACSLICLPQMFVYAPAPAGIALAITLVLILLYAVVIRRQADVSADRMRYQAEEDGLTYSLIDGMQKITLAGAEKRAFAVWARVYRKSIRTIYNPPLLLKVFGILTPVVMLAGTIAMYPAAVKADVSQADFFAFLSSYAILTGALTTISTNAVSFANALPVFRVLKPVMEFAPETGGEKEVVRKLNGNISLRNITFGYTPDMPPVLENLNIEIRRGEYVAIVGPTGGGKSTILRLLLGFEQPDHGDVLYDGRNLKSLDVTSLRRKIGTVLQNGEIFRGTIFSNIAIAGTDLTEDDVWAAAEIAGIADDIRRMPLQLNTPLPDGGRGVSGGQMQRLLVARAVVTKPSVLFFDEATSALDNVTQKAVSDAVGEMACTRLVIAHRLSTIQNCDRILFLDGGHIAEEGSYEELMKKNGLFAAFVKRQQIETELPEEDGKTEKQGL